MPPQPAKFKTRATGLLMTEAMEQFRNRRHILVAEDSPINQRLAIGLLERHGYSVTVVNNGQEALLALEGRRFDAILMDIDMPELDGLSTTRRIRESERGHGDRVPIVAVTTNDNAPECFRAGMDAHLAKPLRAHSLRRILARVLSKTAA
jgi:two-component system, sensor histidine kinase and response regulator